eukprot:TRINITY_DN4748_c0_g1_i2.p1 TRINITY_DN4748_c0_g1~~TRINITY_DN4748_c0_g1_i2.p1  ORF type:complete len:1783 (+),score=324.29 TRINITY_DN4748_c0_g1_i2:765-5351(+)
MKAYIQKISGAPVILKRNRKNSESESETTQTSRTDVEYTNMESLQIIDEILGSITEEDIMFEPYGDDIDINIFSPKIYKPVTVSSVPLDPRPNGSPFSKKYRYKFLLEILDINLNKEQKEPLFYEFALYDKDSQEKISETFYIDENRENLAVQHFDVPFVTESDDITNVRKFTFSTDVQSEDIFLVVKQKRLFGIDNDLGNDVYCKDIDSAKETRFLDEVHQAVVVFPSYNQCMGYGSSRIFENIETTKSITILNSKNNNIFEFLDNQDAKGEIGNLLYRVTECDENIFFEKAYDSSLNPIPLSVDIPDDAKTIHDPVKELYNFSDNFSVNSDLNNDFYLSPLSLNLANIKSASKAKNILIKACVLKNDTIDAKPLKCIYGKSDQKKFVDSATFTVQPGTKKPSFTDEMKIKIPYILSSKLHVRFEFHSLNEKVINSSKKKKSQQASSELIGYSFIPLCSNSMTRNGLHELAFFPHIHEGYLSINEFRSTPFSINIKNTSTVYPNDPHLFSILKKSNASPKILIKSLSADLNELVKFFPLFMNKLLYLMSNSDEELSQQCFESMLYVLLKVDSSTSERDWENESNYNSTLTSYLNYHVKIADSDKPVHLHLINNWTKILKGEGSSSVVANGSTEIRDLSIGKYANFLFTLITRSLLREKKEGKMVMEEHVHSLIITLITTFVENLAGKTIPTFNIEIALWFSDMLHFVDRGQVIDFIRQYYFFLLSTNTSDTLNTKLEFARIITDHEFYVQLNCPVPLPVDGLKGLSKKYSSWNYFAGIILDLIKRSYSSSVEDSIKFSSIGMLRTVIWNHQIDHRYDKDDLPYISSMYLPFLHLVSENRNYIHSLPNVGERLEWMQSLAWILSNCNNDTLTQYFSLHDGTQLLNFIDVLRTLFSTFSEYESISQICMIVIHTLEIISLVAEKELWSNIILFQQITNIYSDILKFKLHFKYQVAVLKSLRVFMIRNSGPFFREIAGVGSLEKLIVSILSEKHCSLHIYNYIASILILILQVNFEETGNITRSKLFMIRAVYHLRNNMDLDVFSSYFKKILKAIFDYFEANEVIFADLVLELLGRLYRIISYNTQSNEPQVKSEQIYLMSNTCSISNDIRLQLLRSLADHHDAMNNIEESAQSYLFMLLLVSQYLNATESVSLYPAKNDLKIMCPNIKSQIPFNFSHDDENIDGYLLQAFESTLNSAAERIINFGLYEVALDMYVMLLNVYKKQKKYEKIVNTHKKVIDLANSSVEAIEKNTRLFDNYYRVAFHGPRFEELDDTEYIYKEHPTLRLADFCDKLKDYYTKKLCTEVINLPGNATAENLDPNKHYMQIVSVEPVPNKRSSNKQVSVVDKNFAIRRFSREMPYSPDGSGFSEDVDKQWKIKHIYETENYFPFISRRSRVISVDDEIVGPLDCSIDLINERTYVLEKELRLTPPNPKTLQIVLQGSVMLQVNAGPLAITRYFLSNEKRAEFPAEKIEELESSLNEFARKLLFCLKLNKTVVDSSTVAHHDAMVEAYGEFCNEVNQYGVKCIPW